MNIKDEYSNEDPNWAIVCPHCGYRHENWQDFIDTDEMSGEFDETCDNEDCEKEFHVGYKTVITFTTTKKE